MNLKYLLRESQIVASEIVDLVKVEDLAFKLLKHFLVHVSRYLGKAEIDYGLN